jgi:hypothetical protein
MLLMYACGLRITEAATLEVTAIDGIIGFMCGRRPRCKRNLTCGLRSGASHVSGLLSRRMTAGPDVIRGSGPNQSDALDSACTKTGSPNRRLDRFASRHHHPRNSLARADLTSSTHCQAS